MQVVAAIRGVTTGAYLAQMKEYEKEPIKPETESYQRILIHMTEQYEEAEARVVVQNAEFIDFHARRLVEMAGNIIMGYLLLMDVQRNHDYWKTLEVFLKFARAKNSANSTFIGYSNLNDLGKFKYENVSL